MKKKIKEALIFVQNAFLKAKIKDALRQAEDLLCDFLNLSRSELFLRHQNLESIQWEELERRVARRLTGVPLQYIHGQVEFYDCLFKLNPSVLIPRQETEILVDKVVHELRHRNLQGQTLWDVCCGSGCIGISLKRKFPQLEVYLSDLSGEALKVAQENALINQTKIIFKQGDLLKPFDGCRTHFFVCNPPYISQNEYLALDDEVLKHEPQAALLSGESGLEFYERLAYELPNYLFPNARVWLEIGYRQGADLMKLFDRSLWKGLLVEKDWAGHDRFFSCTYSLDC